MKTNTVNLGLWLRSVSVLVGLGLTNFSPAQESSATSKAVDLKERALGEKAAADLQAKWAQRLRSGAQPPAAPLAVTTTLEFAPADTGLPAPQRQSLARNAKAEYVEPEVVRAQNGVLRLKLDGAYAHNRIGEDPVYLRNFNGRLVGPTLRVKPGDKIRITLRNSLPGERWRPNMMNTLNSFNTFNLHYHGLHVSPNGISDNVLIQVGPEETQEYEVDVPANHTPGTYWYHPHRHGSTAATVASGMSGALIIEGGLDEIPEIKAARDRVMVLNQIPYVYKNTLNGKKIDLKEGVIEEQYAGDIFGPGDWATLGRYTTINGVQLPVIRLRPGQIERWRLVDSGQRETIELKLVGAPSASGVVMPPIPFYEIAVDGLALGKVVEKSSIELWPGYRSDVLVRAPTTPGEYLLIDDTVPASRTISGQTKPLNYVARVIIEGQPMTMKLPTDQQVAGLRLPSIKDSEITGRQEAKYGILVVGGKVVFTIDGKSFDMETARQLKLNDVDEWTLRSINDVGAVTHPFHIHVNPFEVTSIKAPSADDPSKLVEQLTGGPVWRDTVQIPGNGSVTLRTKYTDFIGTFVQHCHILDHEDQGMMQLIDIVDPKASGGGGGATTGASGAKVTLGTVVPGPGSAMPDFTLPDAQGRMHSLREMVAGKPTVVFFFKGYGCSHCVLQVAAFLDHHEAFARRGVQIVGVTSDSVESLQGESPLPFTLLADPRGEAFARFGCVDEQGLRHGTFSLDAAGRVTWRTVDSTPFLAVRELLPPAQTAVVDPASGATPAAGERVSSNP